MRQTRACACVTCKAQACARAILLWRGPLCLIMPKNHSRSERKPGICTAAQWHASVDRQHTPRGLGRQTHVCKGCNQSGHRSRLVTLNGQDSHFCPMGPCPWRDLGCSKCARLAASQPASSLAPVMEIAAPPLLPSPQENPSAASHCVPDPQASVADAVGKASVPPPPARPNAASSTIAFKRHPLRPKARAQRARHGNQPGHAGSSVRQYSSTADGSRPTWSRKGTSQKHRPDWAPRYSNPEDASPNKKRRMEVVGYQIHLKNARFSFAILEVNLR